MRQAPLEDTRKPFLAFAGLLGAGAGLGSLSSWDTIRSVIEDMGIADWLASEAMLLFYAALLSILAFLLLTLMLIRVLDGVWMFSVARHMVLTAALLLVTLFARLTPENALIGLLLVIFVAAVYGSYLGFGFARAYLSFRACGDLVFELLLFAPFVTLYGLALWATPHVRIAWDSVARIWGSATA